MDLSKTKWLDGKGNANEDAKVSTIALPVLCTGELKSGNTVFQIITLSVAMETIGWIWTNLKLIQAFMHVLIGNEDMHKSLDEF